MTYIIMAIKLQSELLWAGVDSMSLMDMFKEAIHVIIVIPACSIGI
jgi:hypothetical protein